MKFGFIGSGNMAGAFARGLNEPALFADSGSGRAGLLAAELGGTASAIGPMADACNVLVLAHKPKQLKEVAQQLTDFSGTIVSLLAATPLAALREAYPAARIVRTMPNIPIEHGRGVLGVAAESDSTPELDPYFARFGVVTSVPEAEFEVFTAVAGCAPAFFALFAEKLIESSTARGLDPDVAAEIVNQTMLGTAISLRQDDVDTAALMARVASPGGLTERALSSFEATGLADSVEAAVATVLGE